MGIGLDLGRGRLVAFEKCESAADDQGALVAVASEDEDRADDQHVEGVDVGWDLFQNRDEALEDVEGFHFSERG